VGEASKFLLLLLLLSTLVTGCVPIFTQYLLRIIVSGLENSIKFNNFIFLVGFYAFVSIFKNVILNAKEYVNTITSFKLTYNIQNKLIKKIRNVEYKNFYSPDFQNSYVSVLQNCQNEASMLVFSTIFMLSLIVQVVSSCLVIVNFNPIALSLLIVCTVPSVIINIKTKKEQIKTLEERSFSYRKMNYGFNVLTEKPFVKELRLFGLYKFFSNKRFSDFTEYLKIWKKLSRKEFFNKIFSAILPCVGVSLSILWIILQVIKKVYSIADFVFYSGIIFTLQSAFESLALDISQSYKSIAFINKFFNFLEADNEITNGNTKIIFKEHHILELKNVSFKYPNTEKLVIKNINLEIETGQQIALVGKNGCGKTTLVNLILRIFDPTEGVVLLDGIDIRNYDYEEYLKFFSAVFQDYQFYAVKLSDYISFGDIKNQKDTLKIKQAAISATAGELIEKSKKGFDSNLTTLFDKQGLELSGGQWQKLAIARTFFSDANMLIFDEPTSALDAISESEIYQNISNISKNKMSIFISHRMYSSRLAKRIIYIENGEILNDGKHEDLMRNSIGYKELFEEQANKYYPIS
jgi:ABC-type multidrug transport system fused ATPase/permease subunit